MPSNGLDVHAGSHPALAAENLAVERGGQRVLDGVDFAVEQGDFRARVFPRSLPDDGLRWG